MSKVAHVNEHFGMTEPITQRSLDAVALQSVSVLCVLLCLFMCGVSIIYMKL